MRTLLDLVVKIAVNAVALWLAADFVTGITFGRGADTTATVTTVLLVAVVFGLVNAVVKPLAKGVSFLFVAITLGLFLLVINAAMLMLTSWLAGRLDLAFHVEGFGSALLGGIVVTIVTMILNAVIPDAKR